MRAVAVLGGDVHDEVRVQIPVGLADVEPAVDAIVAQEAAEDLARRVDVGDHREASGASRGDRRDRPGKGILGCRLRGGDQVVERGVGEIAVGDTDLR